MATVKRQLEITAFLKPPKRGPASEPEGALSETEETEDVDVDVSSDSDASDHSDVSDGSSESEPDEPGPSEPGPSKAKPLSKGKAVEAAKAAMQLLITSLAAMTDRREQVQAKWTKLRNASVERGEQQVPGNGLLQPAIAKYGLKVCTCCDTVKAVKDMSGKHNFCKLCNPRTKTGKARRAEFRRRVAAARAALYEQNKDDVAIGTRFEVWLLQQLCDAGFIVKLNYEFCRADLLLKREGDTLWYRIQAKGSERDPASFADTFGYGSRAGGVVEPDHRMLVVCGRRDGDAYTLWAMDGGEIPKDQLDVSKADKNILAPESLNLSSTKLVKLVARIHTDLKQEPPPYPLTTGDAAELDITSLKQLKEKVLTLALRECGVCEVEYPRGNSTCIDCSTIFNDDRWIATQVKTFSFGTGFAHAQCSVNGAKWPYPHTCGIERMLEGGIVAKEEDGKWTFWVIYAYQDYEALKTHVFSNLEKGTLGTGSICTRFKTAKQAKEWAGVEQTKGLCCTKWLAEPRHCFRRARIPVEGRLTEALLRKCTSRIIDRNGAVLNEF